MSPDLTLHFPGRVCDEYILAMVGDPVQIDQSIDHQLGVSHNYTYPEQQ